MVGQGFQEMGFWPGSPKETINSDPHLAFPSLPHPPNNKSNKQNQQLSPCTVKQDGVAPLRL